MSYPTSIDTAQDLLVAANNFATSCVGLISTGQTGIAIRSSNGLPASGVVSIDSEVISYDYIDLTGSNPVLHVSNNGRGFDGTTAALHTDGARVELRWVASHHNILSAAIRIIEAVLGVNPQGDFSDVVSRLNATLPVVLTKAVNTTWTFTHTRHRIVNVQLWRKTGVNQYDLFDAGITQHVDPAGTSTVVIELDMPEEGYVIYS